MLVWSIAGVQSTAVRLPGFGVGAASVFGLVGDFVGGFEGDGVSMVGVAPESEALGDTVEGGALGVPDADEDVAGTFGVTAPFWEALLWQALRVSAATATDVAARTDLAERNVWRFMATSLPGVPPC
jgi:hypothetical protein